MPPAAMPSSVFSRIAAACSESRRSRNSRVDAGGNLGARPKPPKAGSKVRAIARSASPSTASVSGSAEGAARDEPADRVDEAPRLARHVAPPLAPCLSNGEEQLPERGKAVPRLGREVRAGVEGLAVGRQEHGHRPAAAARHRDGRVHVERVDVRPLLAVDLDVDEVFVHHGRGRRRPRTTRAPSRGTSGRRCSRPRAGSACPRYAPARAPPRPTGTSPPGCPRAGAGTGLSRARDGSWPGP